MRTILACLLSLCLSVPAMAGTTTALGSGQYLTTVPKQCGGKLYCWGNGTSGDGTAIERSTPTPVKLPIDVTAFKTISTYNNACAVDTQGKAYCWGYNTFGQMGIGTVKTTAVPFSLDFTSYNEPTSVSLPPDVSSLTAISTGGGLLSATTCGLTPNGNAYCWGLSGRGAIGNGANPNGIGILGYNIYPAPTAVVMPNGVTFKTISVGSNGETVCALAQDGRAYCWGANYWGSLGTNHHEIQSENHPLPEQVIFPSGVNAFTTLGTAGQTNCAIADNEKAYCWGANGGGQIGDGTTTSRYVPTQVTMPNGVAAFTTITSGGLLNFHGALGESIGGTTCALDKNGDAYCWGDNALGQVGNGTTSERVLVPTKVNKPNGVNSFTSISTAGYSVCAIGSDKQIYCWGAEFNQPGYKYNININQLSYRDTPTLVPLPSGITGYTSVSVRATGVCALAQ